MLKPGMSRLNPDIRNKTRNASCLNPYKVKFSPLQALEALRVVRG
jgi:hypothetical protein